MDYSDMIERLKAITGETDENILVVYLDTAKDVILRRLYPYGTKIDQVPSPYMVRQVEIAAYLLNKRGAEGELTHTENGMSRTIITVIGKDTVGIIAKVCTYLADNQVNILDISQTIVSGFFNMMMVVDATACPKEHAVLAAELDALGVRIGVKIQCQKEEIFSKMHRL